MLYVGNVYLKRLCDMDKENQNLTGLLEKIKYDFKNEDLLRDALTHPSIAGLKRNKKNKVSSYERLEFLGDRVLGLVIAHWLYELYPNVNEGELAKRHSSLVNRDALRDVGSKIEIEKYLRHIKATGKNINRQNLSSISDGMESIIGAIYLDGGLLPAENFIKEYWHDAILIKQAPSDPKTQLQEYAQGKSLPLPVYNEVSRTGPAHAPVFVIEVSIEGFEAVNAKGISKRMAEKEAAILLLKEIEKHDK